VDLSFGATYPRDPPRCEFLPSPEPIAPNPRHCSGRFVTKIFHPNVVRHRHGRLLALKAALERPGRHLC
jgi:ubiquitin-protein ligase